ncbi:MAG: AAA family ATPase [Candidatus Methylacidiphilales bacterium]|nr:MoxR family ATPase [Candidatus Methylacidiphilales bacterium]
MTTPALGEENAEAIAQAEEAAAAAESPAAEQMSDLDAVQFCRNAYVAVQNEIAKVVVGQTKVVDEILISIFTRSHALLVGVPGLAKTLLISTLAKTLHMSFKRIQFTPDLMPSDITGTEVIYQDPSSGQKEFKFMPGPLFANIVLADEINRTPPKTQAAMLEAMQERRVTVGGNTHKLPVPFFVLATQNPLEQEGTYPLPEAQLDRFMFLINVDYPSEEEELLVMKMGTGMKTSEPQAVLSIEHVLFIQETVKSVPVADHVYRYAEKIVRSTRPKQEDALDYCKRYLSFGAGPRASLSLIMAAKAHALVQGQVYAGCENVAAVAHSILRHRIAPNFSAQSEGITADDIVQNVLQSIPQHG